MDKKELQAYAFLVERQSQELKARLKHSYKVLDYTTKFLGEVINDCGLEKGLKSKILKEAEIELMQIELTIDRIRDKIPKWEAEAKRLKKMVNQGGSDV